MRELIDKASDAEFVRRAREGDRAAFGELATRHEVRALSSVRHILADRDSADDVVQEALLHAYLSLTHLRSDERFGDWLAGIARNLARKLIEREVRRDRLFEAGACRVAEEAGETSSPHDDAASAELAELVARAEARLPLHERETVRLRYRGQLSIREVARELGVPMGTVKARLHRARSRMREVIAKIAPELVPKRARGEEMPMVDLKIADVVGGEALGDGSTRVVLLDEESKRVLIIWIGETEARAIAYALRGVELPRPLTHELAARLVEASGSRVERVRIDALREKMFYAVVELATAGGTREVDARPSDALALAARAGAPIVAPEELMEGPPAVDVPDSEPSGRGMDQLIAEHQGVTRTRDKEIEQVIEFVFGSGG